MKNKVIDIVKANYFKNYKLEITFSDDVKQLVDFEQFLSKSTHPEIKKYHDMKKFKKFKLVNGDLMWGDFDLIFPVIDLYQNKLG